MLQTETPQSFNSFSVPGKVFLLGEYAVLAGRPAVVAAVEPRFSLTQTEGESIPEFHPESPVSRLMAWARKMGVASPGSLRFEDPFDGAGGFGGSTAEFALTYFSMAQRTSWDRDWKTVWRLYRELMSGEGIAPSGVDLVAQWQGGVVFFDPSDEHCMDLWPLLDGSAFLVFSAASLPGRKVPTHEHLRTLKDLGFPGKHETMLAALEESLVRGISAIQEGQIRELGQAMQSYAQTLSLAGLETPAAYEDRRALSALPGVLGVKGAGALLSDSVIVLLEPRTQHREAVIRAAEQRGLVLVSDGLTCQVGVSCQLQ